MKIRKIIIENNPRLGERLELDFTYENGSTADTILLVGENGAGKSTILDIINEFQTFNPISEGSDNEKRIFEIEFNEAEMQYLNLGVKGEENKNKFYLGNVFEFTFDLSISKTSWTQCSVRYAWNRTEISIGETQVDMDYWMFPSEEVKKELFKSIYSGVSINFDSKNIEKITNKDIDDLLVRNKKTNESIATEITQLLIDIRNKDNEEQISWQEQHPSGVIPQEIQQRRTKRFRTAFNSMFEGKLIFEGITNLKPIFRKGSSLIEINGLSSGEKQIVFRGSYLLKDKESIKGAIALIDEPEISLHPAWQLKILEFYKNLFKDESNIQTSQIFVVTHSPFILHSSERNNDKVVALEKNDSGNVIVNPDAKYFGYTDPVKFSKESFNITSLDTSKSNFLFVEDTYDTTYKIAWLKLSNITIPNIESVSSLFEENCNFIIESKGGHDGVRGVLNQSGVRTLEGRKIVGLFDFDEAYESFSKLKTTNNWSQIQGDKITGLYKKRVNHDISALLLPVPISRNGIASIECASRSGLEMEYLFEDDVLRRVIPNTGDNKSIPNITLPSIGDKSLFASRILTLSRENFSNFIPLFKRVHEFFGLPEIPMV